MRVVCKTGDAVDYHIPFCRLYINMMLLAASLRVSFGNVTQLEQL